MRDSLDPTRQDLLTHVSFLGIRHSARKTGLSLTDFSEPGPHCESPTSQEFEPEREIQSASQTLSMPFPVQA